MTKLNYDDVWDILERLDDGELQAAVARDYHVTPELLSMIYHQKRWGAVSADMQRPKPDLLVPPPVPRGTRKQILRRAARGERYRDIADDYGLAHGTIGTMVYRARKR